MNKKLLAAIASIILAATAVVAWAQTASAHHTTVTCQSPGVWLIVNSESDKTMTFTTDQGHSGSIGMGGSTTVPHFGTTLTVFGVWSNGVHHTDTGNGDCTEPTTTTEVTTSTTEQPTTTTEASTSTTEQPTTSSTSTTSSTTLPPASSTIPGSSTTAPETSSSLPESSTTSSVPSPSSTVNPTTTTVSPPVPSSEPPDDSSPTPEKPEAPTGKLPATE